MRVVIDARPLDVPALRAQGIGRYVEGLLAPLADVAAGAGHELVALRGPRPEGAPFPGVDRRVARRPSVPERVADLPEQVLLPFDLRRARAEVAHATSVTRLALAPGVPTVVTVHDAAPLMWPEHYLQTGLAHHLLYAAARRARLLLAVSESAAGDVASHLGVPRERVVVAPLAAGAHFAPTDAPSPIEGPYVLYVGGLAAPDWRKNVDGLLDAFARWRHDRVRPETLVMAGRTGPESDRLAGRARELGVPVAFPGFVAEADLPALYAGASCFVTASRYEGFGLPALESIACGTPVVAFRAGAVPEVAGPGALLAPDGDLDALVRAVESVCDDPGVRDRLRSDGLRHATRFSWRRTAELTWEAYGRCLAS